MNYQELAQQLTFHNPWWSNGHVPTAFLPAYKRQIYPTLLSYLPLDRIMMIKGPRRTGKTTLLYQLIDHLLKKQVQPKDICYLSFDDPLLKAPLQTILEAIAFIRGKAPHDGHSYIFLDEAQLLPEWELAVKLYYDRKYPIKFFVSGSSVSLLTQHQESLAGRTIEETLFPFSFAEVASHSLTNPSFDEALKQIREETLLTEYPALLVPFTQQLIHILDRYLRFGGFPHLLNTPDELWMKLLREDIVEKVVFRDIVERFNVREPSSLERLLAFVGKNTSGIINITTLASSLGLSRPIIEQYLSYLEQSMLLIRQPKFSYSLQERLRSSPKGHLIDPGLGTLFGAPVDQQLESAVTISLFIKYGQKLHFWRDSAHEVDALIEQEPLLPIEVKNNEQTTIPDSLAYFMDKRKLSEGTVVYQGKFERQTVNHRTVTFIPAHLFLLL